MKPLALRTKLAIFYAAAVACVLVCLGVLAYAVAAQRFARHSDEALDHLAAGVGAYLRFADGEPILAYDANEREVSFFLGVATQYLQVYDLATGTLISESEASRLLDLAISPEQVAAVQARLAADPGIERLAPPADFDDVQVEKAVRPSMFDDVEGAGAKFRFHSMVIRDPAGHGYLVRVGKSTVRDAAALREIRNTLLMLVPVGVLLAAAGGWLMSRRALKPVDDLRAAAQRISISHLHRRLPSRGAGDELDRLAETFNSVFRRLEAAVEQMKQFTASMAHEIRTPLSVLQGEAEFALMHGKSVEEYQRVLTSQLVEFSRLSEMFTHLLLVARAEAGQVQLAKDTVDLAALAQSLAEQMKPVAEYAKVSLCIEGEGSVLVVGDASWLRNIVLNLLDNAVKFTPAGGEIRVAVWEREDKAVLEIRDTGIGIPAEAIPYVFDRFFRVDSSRSSQIPGAGLGLTIVKWAVEAQGGVIQVDSTPGAGSRFTVLLPLAFATAVKPAEETLRVSAVAQH